MSNQFVKITVGFIHQTFRKNSSGKFICTEQVFIAGDECTYEDKNGDPLAQVPQYVYQPYEMVCPSRKKPKVKYLLYNEVLGCLEDEVPIEAASLEEALLQALKNRGYSVIEAKK